jgi:hypothetical protein
MQIERKIKPFKGLEPLKGLGNWWTRMIITSLSMVWEREW